MRIVTLNSDLFTLFNFDPEIIQFESLGNKRPFVMILKLNYKDQKLDFATPFRSNIPVNSANRDTYFALPRRNTTKDKHAHGLHYIKMMPVDVRYCNKYNFPMTQYDSFLDSFIRAHTDQIVRGAQNYLKDYQQGIRPQFCTDIDRLLTVLNCSKADS